MRSQDAVRSQRAGATCVAVAASIFVFSLILIGGRADVAGAPRTAVAALFCDD